MNELDLNLQGTKLDKMRLKNGEILSIDNLEELKERKLLFVNENIQDDNNNNDMYMVADNKAFSYMKIGKDGEINLLKAGMTGLKKPFVTLQTNVCDKNIGNLRGNTVKEYYEQ